MMKLNPPKLALSLSYLVALYRGVVALGGLLFNAFVCGFCYLCTLGKSTRLNYEYISCLNCRVILRLMGLRVSYPPKSAYPKKTVVYTFNHNSFLDAFIIPALGIPHCRCVLNENSKSIIPLHLCNITNGTIYIPLPKKTLAREDFFKRWAKKLTKNKYSLFCSSEGNHDFVHGIAPFNTGIYKMALQAKVDICPLYFHIPKASNPFKGFVFKAGKINIEILPMIETKKWKDSELDSKVEQVRSMYIRHFEMAHQNN